MNRLLNSLILIFASSILQAQVNTDALKFKMDSVLSGISENGPGASIYIQQGNQTLYSNSFGLVNTKTKEKFTENTISNIGGISKTFIAYSILILHQQGKLSIEDPVNKYFPDFVNKEIASKVTIKHLLMHTSGFVDLLLSKKDSISAIKINDEQNFESLKSTNKLAFEPGSNFSYSNKAYSGLVLIIERMSGLKFGEFVSQNILVPSGMTFTKFTNNLLPEAGVAHAYRTLNKKFKEYDTNECPGMETMSSAGIWTNIVDLRKYMNAIKYHIFLDSSSVKLSQQFATPLLEKKSEPSTHGICWFGATPKNKDAFIEYHGNQCAFRAYIIYFPEKELTVFYLSNNQKDYSKILVSQLKRLNFIQ